MGYLGATLTQVFTRTCAGGADVSLRDVIITQMGNGASKCEWRHPLEARGGFGEFLKCQLVELRPASGEDGWLSLARGGLRLVSHEIVVGGRWKSRNRKNVYFFPYVEEPLNSKVIKCFVPEQRSRKCFSCSEIRFLCSLLYIYEHYMSISHIAVSGYGT